jgi:hypothetical protein
MKRSRNRFLILTLLVAAMVIPGVTMTGDAWAVSLEGNYCWNLTITDSSSGGIGTVSLLRMHMKSLDDYTFAAQGIIAKPGDGSMIFGGTGRMGNPTIVLNLDVTKPSNSGPSREAGVVRLVFDSTTYKGTFWHVGTSYDLTSHNFENVYTAGTIAKVACQ